MYRNKFMLVAAVALGLNSFSAFAARDFSALSTAELMQLKPSEMSEEDHNAFRAEVQKRSVNTSPADKEESRKQTPEQKKGQGGGGKQGGGMGRGH